MSDQNRIRTLLLEQLEGKNAHIDFNNATKELKLNDVGVRPQGLPHSIWELAEHIRIAQYDILDFSRNPNYEAISWRDSYWPSSAKPENKKAWDKTLQSVENDRQAMVELIKDPDNNLLEPFPYGDGQTLFREAMLIVDHNAYHIAQIVQVRRILGIW